MKKLTEDRKFLITNIVIITLALSLISYSLYQFYLIGKELEHQRVENSMDCAWMAERQEWPCEPISE